MIVHLVPDEKFIDGFIRHQEKYFPEIENHYLVLPNKPGALKHVKSANIEVISSDFNYEKLLTKFKKTPAQVIIHGAFIRFKVFIRSAPQELIIGWIFYGYEIFGRLEEVNSFLAPQTNNIYKKRYKANNKIKVKKEIFKLTSTSLAFPFGLTPFTRTLNRINYMAHWVKEDYNLIKKKYNLRHLQFVDFCYSNDSVSIDKKVGEGEDLFIGNSASYTNNHLDVFDMLSTKFVQNFRKVIIPLSYGDPVYAGEVKQVALKKFGDKAFVLDSFMDKTAYFKLLGNVKLAIMGHYRSQAGGNIRFFLKNGIDVALFQENNIYKFYQRKGVEIHNLREIVNKNSFFLTDTALNNNQKRQAELFEMSSIEKYYGTILKYSKT